MNETKKKISKLAIAYYRVSTGRQGESGLGLEAQRDSVHLYTRSKKIKLIKEFIEVESGRKKKRPVLLEALEYCKENQTIFIIAKLNRLARNVAFVAALLEGKIKFVSVQFPDASKLILHIIAAIDQYESEEISENTKAALQAAKKRGVKLGTYGKTLAKRNKKASHDFAKKMKPIIHSLIDEGFHSIQAITNELNKRKIMPFRQTSQWHKSTVHNLLSHF